MFNRPDLEELKNLLEEFEKAKDGEGGLYKLASLFVYLILQNKDHNEQVIELLNRLTGKEFLKQTIEADLKIDFSETNAFLKKIAEKEVKFPKQEKMPEFPKLDVSELAFLLTEIKTLLNERKDVQVQPIVVHSQAQPEKYGGKKEAFMKPSAAAGTWAVSAMFSEVPSGAINGTNTTYFLTRAPKNDSYLLLYRGGNYQTPGGVDYTRTGNQIVYIKPLLSDRGDGNPESHYAHILVS